MSGRYIVPHLRSKSSPAALPATQSYLSNSWRAATTSQRQLARLSPPGNVPEVQARTRAHVKAWQVGDIAFLPKDIPQASVCWQHESHEDTYGHPVLITAVNSDNGVVGVMIITSFANKSIKARFPGKLADDNEVRAHLLISDIRNGDGSYSHPDKTMPALSLANNKQMEKVSYLRRDREIPVEAMFLVAHKINGREQAASMTRESMADLQHVQEMQPVKRIYGDGTGWQKSTSEYPFLAAHRPLPLNISTNTICKADLERLRTRSAPSLLAGRKEVFGPTTAFARRATAAI